MLTYNLAELKGESMYIHLYKCIKKDIEGQTIKAHERLPSKRSLARNLGVSLITVENAYAQLQVEGYIYSLPKKGYFASKIQPPPAVRLGLKATLPAMQPPKAPYADFTSSDVPEDTFPYGIWARLLRQTLTTVDEHSLLRDNASGGVFRLRCAIAKHLYQFRGMSVDPQQLIIGAGTQTQCGLLVQLLGRDKTFALEDPCYPKLAAVYRSNAAGLSFLPMDASGIEPHSLKESRAQVLHISPSHQFPTGIVMPVKRRYELLAWAQESKDRYIIEDDYDCEFRLFGRPIPSLQSIDTAEKVIYSNTFSKTLAPTFRISYLLLPRPLAEAFYRDFGFYAGTVSNFEQFTLARFIEEGHFERHLNRMRTCYRNKRDKLLKCLAELKFSKALQVEGENSGLHFLLHLATDAPDSLLAEVAAKENIRIKFLSSYYHDQKSDDSHTLLMNYTGIPESRLAPALEKLFGALSPYLKF